MPIPYLFYIVSYFPFLFLLWISKAKRGLRLFDENGLASNQPMVIILLVGGILLFGTLPLLSDHPGTFVLLNRDTLGNLSTWMTILLCILSLLVTPRILEKKFSELPDVLPVHNAPGLSFNLLYFFLRIVFISVYECWFRGFLLTDCMISFGVFWAIVINLSLYAILHIANGKEEVMAGFPYGLLLCTLCIWQKAVWPAVVIHLALTIPYEFGFLRKLKTKITLHHEHTSHRSLGLYR